MIFDHAGDPSTPCLYVRSHVTISPHHEVPCCQSRKAIYANNDPRIAYRILSQQSFCLDV
eukprot:scaffold255579_cov15-Prasinocladus_malaysianus.AAC.1